AIEIAAGDDNYVDQAARPHSELDTNVNR
ncbi:MAG: hypothetical protein QOI10_4616, partial [Solirubrobacterales bacterium]|nr:hypothetical protein [Solirubrobacterales bacterium]